jgi:hypothetical protein
MSDDSFYNAFTLNANLVEYTIIEIVWDIFSFLCDFKNTIPFSSCFQCC